MSARSSGLAVVVASAAFVFACGPGTDGGKGGGSGGGTGGGVAGGTGGGVAGGTAGGVAGGTGGGGAQCTPQVVNVTVGSNCSALPAPGACGGSLTGRYCYTGFCVDESRLLPGVQSSCAAAGGVVVFSSTAGTVNGSLEFAGGTVTRNATLTITGTATVPAICAATGCGTVRAAFTAAGATATCVASGGGCSCTYSTTPPTSTSDPFSTLGGTITVRSRTYEYCVDTGMRYRESTASAAEPGYATLSR